MIEDVAGVITASSLPDPPLRWGRYWEEVSDEGDGEDKADDEEGDEEVEYCSSSLSECGEGANARFGGSTNLTSVVSG